MRRFEVLVSAMDMRSRMPHDTETVTERFCPDCSKSESVPVRGPPPAMVKLSVLILWVEYCLRVSILVSLLNGNLVCADDDAWPRYAHDAALTGRSPLQGEIRIPRESWSVSLTGVQLDVEVSATDGEHIMRLHDGPDQQHSFRKWTRQTPRHMDITGTGHQVPVVETRASRWGRFFRKSKGCRTFAGTTRGPQNRFVSWN
jgi:hypothetical protein